MEMQTIRARGPRYRAAIACRVRSVGPPPFLARAEKWWRSSAHDYGATLRREGRGSDPRPLLAVCPGRLPKKWRAGAGGGGEEGGGGGGGGGGGRGGAGGGGVGAGPRVVDRGGLKTRTATKKNSTIKKRRKGAAHHQQAQWRCVGKGWPTREANVRRTKFSSYQGSVWPSAFAGWMFDRMDLKTVTLGCSKRWRKLNKAHNPPRSTRSAAIMASAVMLGAWAASLSRGGRDRSRPARNHGDHIVIYAVLPG